MYTTAESIKVTLQQLAQKDRSMQVQKFFKMGEGEYAAGDQFHGVYVPVLRKLAKECRILLLDEVGKLLRSPFNEERLLALLILNARYKKGTQDEREQIYQFYMRQREYVNNWNLVDGSAPYIVGEYLLNSDKAVLFDLVRSENIWERRISIVATAAFIRRHEFETTLKISEILLEDSQDLIHKATGWMLREVGKRDETVLEMFLKQYSVKMPRTMLRYALERMVPEKKKYYLQKKY